MLAVSVENDYKIDIALQPMAQSGFYRFAFTEIFFVNDHFRAGFACALRGFISRAIVDNQNVVELLSSSSNDVADMFLFVVSGNDRRDFRRLHPQRTTG